MSAGPGVTWGCTVGGIGPVVQHPQCCGGASCSVLSAGGPQQGDATVGVFPHVYGPAPRALRFRPLQGTKLSLSISRLPRKRSGESRERHLTANQEAEIAVEAKALAPGEEGEIPGLSSSPSSRSSQASSWNSLETGHLPKVSLALLPSFLALLNCLQ